MNAPSILQALEPVVQAFEALGIGYQIGGSVASSAYEQLNAEGIRARVVSMPSWEIFERQTLEYRDSVLPPSPWSRRPPGAGRTMSGWTARFSG